jgi:2-succinyl-5-enolpyruvyl-6-hydroxy-3-cyclohexene-1-carboxylate synthase
VALVGDLAFAYDVSSLLWARERELSLDIVVLDNGGGGIFSFLPQASSQPGARFERLWATPHGTDLVALARGYGVEAKVLEDLESLHKALSVPPKRGVRVWVAKGTRNDNLTLHQRLWSEIEKAIGGALGTGAGAA